MAYTTIDDVKSIKGLANTLGAGPAQYTDLELSALIIESDALIDNDLSPVYTVPLTGTLTAAIERMAKCRAAYMLVCNTLGNDERSEKFTFLKTEADEILKNILDTKPTIGTNVPNVTGGARIQSADPERYFAMGDE